MTNLFALVMFSESVTLFRDRSLAGYQLSTALSDLKGLLIKYILVFDNIDSYKIHVFDRKFPLTLTVADSLVCSAEYSCWALFRDTSSFLTVVWRANAWLLSAEAR